VRIKLNTFDIYAFLDPAGKKRGADQLKKVRANSALIVIGVEPSPTQRVFVLEAWRGKTPASVTMEKVFEFNARWRPKIFGVEANAMQELYAQMLTLEAQNRAISINLAEVHQPTNVEKHWRIRTSLNPITNYGRLFLAATHTELRNEMTVFPMSPLVDLIDALASACALIPPRPKPPADESDEASEVAAYLRARGVAPQLIAQRMAAIRAGR
jgi:hypothetical protein